MYIRRKHGNDVKLRENYNRWSSVDWIKTRLEIGTHSQSSENIIYAHDYFPR